LIGTEHQPEGKGIITVKETTAVITSEDKGTITATKETAPKTTSKEMLPQLGTRQTPASNAEKWDTTPETAQSVVQIANTTEWPT